MWVPHRASGIRLAHPVNECGKGFIYRACDGESTPHRTKRVAMVDKQGSTMVFNADNVSATLDSEGILTVLIDTNQRIGESESGKSVNVASTHGNKPIRLPSGDSMRFGVTCYVPKPKTAAIVAACSA